MMIETTPFSVDFKLTMGTQNGPYTNVTLEGKFQFTTIICN
jgi:hypothetical protein